MIIAVDRSALGKLLIEEGESAGSTQLSAPFRVVRLTEGMLQLAGRLPHRNLGTLDATHIATALSIEAEMIITFDARQGEAARHEGLQVATPQ